MIEANEFLSCRRSDRLTLRNNPKLHYSRPSNGQAYQECSVSGPRAWFGVSTQKRLFQILD